MKTFLTSSFAIVFALCFSACSQKPAEQPQSSDQQSPGGSQSPSAQSAPVTKGKYGLKSGIVTMKTETMGQEIATTIYFDDYGKKEYQETLMEMEVVKGQKIKVRSVSLVPGDGYRYQIDMEKKEGKKMKDYGGGSSSNIDVKSMSDKMIKEYGIKKEDNETIAGKDCEVYSMDGNMGKGRFANWQGISMKMDATMMKMKIEMKATKIEENVVIPASRFEVPKDVKMTEM